MKGIDLDLSSLQFDVLKVLLRWVRFQLVKVPVDVALLLFPEYSLFNSLDQIFSLLAP